MELSIIIPIMAENDIIQKYLESCLTSVKELNDCEKCNVIMVGPKPILDEAVNIFNNTVRCPQHLKAIELESNNYIELVNYGVMNCLTPYFTVIELTGLLTPYWVRYASQYMEKCPEYSAIIPMQELVNEDEDSLAFGNEIVWSAAFNETDKLGVITKDCLRLHIDFNPHGGIFKTEEFIANGKLNAEAKIFAWYEYLIKYVSNNKLAFVTPCVGYIRKIKNDGNPIIDLTDGAEKEELKAILDNIIESHFDK